MTSSYFWRSFKFSSIFRSGPPARSTLIARPEKRYKMEDQRKSERSHKSAYFSRLYDTWEKLPPSAPTPIRAICAKKDGNMRFRPLERSLSASTGPKVANPLHRDKPHPSCPFGRHWADIEVAPNRVVIFGRQQFQRGIRYFRIIGVVRRGRASAEDAEQSIRPFRPYANRWRAASSRHPPVNPSARPRPNRARVRAGRASAQPKCKKNASTHAVEANAFGRRSLLAALIRDAPEDSK
jgi:hypothetical protein